jgi:hypothetical protein
MVSTPLQRRDLKKFRRRKYELPARCLRRYLQKSGKRGKRAIAEALDQGYRLDEIAVY